MTQPTPILSNSDTDAPGAWHRWSVAIGYSLAWMMAALVLAGVAAGCTPGIILPWFGPMTSAFTSPASALLIAATLTIMVRRIRRQRALAIVGYLDQSTRLNLPLPRFLWAAAKSERGRTAARLFALQDVLRSGWPLSEALEATVPEVPPRIVRLIAAGERNGRLRETLREITRQEDQVRQPGIDRAVFSTFYPVLLLTLISGILTFLMIFIIPKFREIFNDFRTELPESTTRLINLSDWFINGWGWVLFVPIVLGLLWFIGQRLAEIFDAQQLSTRLGVMLKDYALWYLPITHGLERNRGLADVCQVMADALRNGRPLQDALATAEKLQLNAVLADRVANLTRIVERGRSLSQAAAQVGLPELMSGMFATGEASASLPDTCEFLAHYYRSRFNYLLVLAHNAIEPAMVLCMGMLVGYVVISLFLPLVKLIDGVISFYPGI